MDRKQTTKFLSDLLINVKFSGMGKYWASEVTLDYMMGKGKEKHWTLKTISAAHKQARKRSMNELLFCMLRAGH